MHGAQRGTKLWHAFHMQRPGCSRPSLPLGARLERGLGQREARNGHALPHVVWRQAAQQQGQRLQAPAAGHGCEKKKRGGGEERSELSEPRREGRAMVTAHAAEKQKSAARMQMHPCEAPGSRLALPLVRQRGARDRVLQERQQRQPRHGAPAAGAPRQHGVCHSQPPRLGAMGEGGARQGSGVKAASFFVQETGAAGSHLHSLHNGPAAVGRGVGSVAHEDQDQLQGEQEPRSWALGV